MKKLSRCLLVVVLVLGVVSYSFASTLNLKEVSSGTIKTAFSGKVGESFGSIAVYVDDRLAKTAEVISGTLPDGVEIHYGHFIDGYPTKSGTYSLTLRATYKPYNKETLTATGSFTITVLKNPDIKQPTITGSFNDGKPNEPYSSKIYASDGDNSSYKWDYSGTLPNGLTLSAAGDTYELIGTPTKAGEFTFTVYLWDKYEPENGKASKTFTVNITDGSEPAPIGPTPDPEPGEPEEDIVSFEYDSFICGSINQEYEDFIKVSGGVGKYSWSYDGDIPDGLSFWTAGDNDEYIGLEGTPTKAGTFTFSLKATDEEGNSKKYNFTVTIDEEKTEHEIDAEKEEELRTISPTKNPTPTVKEEDDPTTPSTPTTSTPTSTDIKTEHDVNLNASGGCETGLGILGLVLFGTAFIRKRS